MSEKTTKESNQLYEIGFHIVGTIDSSKVASTVDEIKNLISKYDGEVVKEGEVKEMTLAYTMVKKIGGRNQKFNQSYFDWIKFTIDSEKITEFKDAIELNEDILRFMVIKTVDDYEHSTTKLADELKEQEESEEEISADKDSQESEKESEREKPAKETSQDEEIDKAIDEIVK